MDVSSILLLADTNTNIPPDTPTTIAHKPLRFDSKHWTRQGAESSSAMRTLAPRTSTTIDAVYIEAHNTNDTETSILKYGPILDQQA